MSRSLSVYSKPTSHLVVGIRKKESCQGHGIIEGASNAYLSAEDEGSSAQDACTLHVANGSIHKLLRSAEPASQPPRRDRCGTGRAVRSPVHKTAGDWHGYQDNLRAGPLHTSTPQLQQVESSASSPPCSSRLVESSSREDAPSAADGGCRWYRVAAGHSADISVCAGNLGGSGCLPS